MTLQIPAIQSPVVAPGGTATVPWYVFFQQVFKQITAPPVAAVLSGTVMEWGGASVPDGYLLCNGAAYSRAVYAALFAAIGTTQGAGDGFTTFNVPNITVAGVLTVIKT
jgi:microcystin-dependent protein